MEHNIYLYILVVAGGDLSHPGPPLTLIRREIKNTFLRSFLYYVPYVTPGGHDLPRHPPRHGQHLVQPWRALVVGVLVAWFSGNLFLVAASGVSDCIPGRTHRVKFGMGLEGWCFVRKAGDAGESGCLPGG